MTSYYLHNKVSKLLSKAHKALHNLFPNYFITFTSCPYLYISSSHSKLWEECSMLCHIPVFNSECSFGLEVIHLLLMNHYSPAFPQLPILSLPWVNTNLSLFYIPISFVKKKNLSSWYNFVLSLVIWTMSPKSIGSFFYLYLHPGPRQNSHSEHMWWMNGCYSTLIFQINISWT